MDDRRAAFEALFTEHHAAVLRYVERRVDDRERARELTMDCFEIAWRRFDPTAPYRRPWLLQTARNLVGDTYRRRDTERTGLAALAAIPRSDESFAHVELRVAMTALKDDDREVLELFYWDGLSADEIAEAIGCRTAAAWKRLSRARAALRALLEEPAEPTGSQDRVPPEARPAGHGGVVSYALD
ncbi:sigma-70 family RNA polymerase sigma factor [Microbacterium sp. NEAU-LLC]|uniref:Sigma-70 family RNA polymerase sigma factor n=1 Tax=Microbacterium helvum TaxID=2773713 RepID=A0ABR8NR47_9MICO|nr:sigma-70 family RNA polymerase sigma factor [Microbacterium helvum]MBD3943122.1 sigma-70 family RNA polymerase sigma factor [Microbacterium helvum]